MDFWITGENSKILLINQHFYELLHEVVEFY